MPQWEHKNKADFTLSLLPLFYAEIVPAHTENGLPYWKLTIIAANTFEVENKFSTFNEARSTAEAMLKNMIHTAYVFMESKNGVLPLDA